MVTPAPMSAARCLFVVTAALSFSGASAQSAAQMRLQTAVQANDAAGIDQAVKAGADLNARGGGGQTPLMSAVLSGKTEAVRALLKHQPDVTIGEKDGYTPMHGAGFQVVAQLSAVQGRAEIAKLLLAHGLDPMDRHSDGFIGMHRACWGREQRHTDTVQAFLEGGVKPDAMATNGQKPIEMAGGNPATKKLLEAWLKDHASSGNKKEL